VRLDVSRTVPYGAEPSRVCRFDERDVPLDGHILGLAMEYMGLFRASGVPEHRRGALTDLALFACLAEALRVGL
jgi:hypothetical protein